MVQPYLSKYQTDDLMLLFLGQDLEKLHRSLLQLVIQPDILEKCESPADLLQMDFLDRYVYLKLKDIHFGFSTEEEEFCYNKIKYLQVTSNVLRKKQL